MEFFEGIAVVPRTAPREYESRKREKRENGSKGSSRTISPKVRGPKTDTGLKRQIVGAV